MRRDAEHLKYLKDILREMINLKAEMQKINKNLIMVNNELMRRQQHDNNRRDEGKIRHGE